MKIGKNSQQNSQQIPVDQSLRFFGQTVVKGVIASIAIAALAGCAAVGTPKTPEETVRQLATQRWQALLAGDFEKAYEFAVPSYRQLKTSAYYRTKRLGTPVKWISVEVINAQCEALKCEVRIKLESKPIVPINIQGNMVGGLDETWVFEQGRWWMFETI